MKIGNLMESRVRVVNVFAGMLVHVSLLSGVKRMKITSSAFAYTGHNEFAVPTAQPNEFMMGMADIKFTPLR